MFTTAIKDYLKQFGVFIELDGEMAKVSADRDSWNAAGVIRRDFRSSHDGPEEIPAGRKKKSKKLDGCPANDMNRHIYIMQAPIYETSIYPLGTGRFLTTIMGAIYKVCCGCDKRKFVSYDMVNERRYITNSNPTIMYDKDGKIYVK